MVHNGSKTGFILVLLGGIFNMLIAINILGPFLWQQILAAYFAITGAIFFPMAFRMRRQRTIQNASWISLILGIFSLNVLTCIGAAFGLTHAFLQKREHIKHKEHHHTPHSKTHPHSKHKKHTH